MTTSLDQETITAISSSRFSESKGLQWSPASSLGRGTDEYHGQNALQAISSEPSWSPAFQSEDVDPPDLLPQSSGLSPLSNNASTTATPQLSATASALSLLSNDASTMATPEMSTTVVEERCGNPDSGESVKVEKAPVPSLALTYFEAEVGSNNKSNRVKHLVRAADSFNMSQQLDFGAFALVVDIWTKNCKECSGTRLQRLFLVSIKFDHHLTNLFGTLFFSHEVDYATQSRDLTLSKGEKAPGVAFAKLACELHIPVHDVKAKYKRSKMLLLVLAKDGPGTLLQLGTGVDSIWEVKFAKKDVEALLQYRKKHLPHLEKQARELDKYASNLLLDAMIAYGWSYRDLANSRTELAVCLQRYSNLLQLAKMEGELAVMQSLRYSPTGGDPGTSENKRPYDGPVKPFQRAEGIEGLDISMMMQEHAAGNLDIATVMQEPERLGVDILTMMQAHPTGDLDISTIMQPALPFGQMGVGVAFAEAKETRYNLRRRSGT